MQTNRKSPTTDEVLARQAADHAPKPVQPRPKPAQPSAGNGGNALVAKPPAQAQASMLPAVPDSRTNVERYLDEVAPSMIVGRLSKFSKEGKFILNDTQEEVSPETDYVALCPEALAGWILFRKDAPPDRVMGLLYGGFVMPPRDTLGDLDPSEWPLGLSGAPDDPWKHQIYLPLQNADTREFITFVTSSKTGRSAVGSLLRHYERMRKSHPGELPVVRLKTGGFNHKDERIGWVNTPTFVVVGRAPADSVSRPDTSLATDMNDDLPDFA
jgi:hypothetical protein